MTNALMQKYGTLVYNSYQRLEITWIVREKKYLATPRYNNNLNDIWVYQKFLYQEKKSYFSILYRSSNIGFLKNCKRKAN